ncbi:WhiB family transcription factor [Mycobacterium phage Cracklewink]|nr:WhiB family transcription factor [Mycobacterium phage Cracklewink]
MTTACSKCRQRPATGGRGLCENCWAVNRRKLMAYGRWDPDQLDPTPTRQHLAALQQWGMGTRRLQELTGLSRPTLQGIPEAAWVTRKTEAALLAVPIPTTVFDPVLADGTQISSVGSRRRLCALSAIGWSGEALAEQLGVMRHRVQAITSGRQPKVTVARARDIAHLFNRLQLTEGPSRKARRVAQLKGWPLPLQWDEDRLDDPRAKPHKRRGPKGSAEDRITELYELGIRDTEAMAERLGIKPESVVRQINRMRAAS